MLSVALARRAPGAALAVVWLVCGLQVVNDLQLMIVELAVAVTAFGTARWGRPARPGRSAACRCRSAAIIAAVYLDSQGERLLPPRVDHRPHRLRAGGAASGRSRGWCWSGWSGCATLGVPWLAGLTLRFRDRARESRVSQVAAEEDAARAEVAAEQSREIAQLREDQARLARDVHDVVGHSLAVILAQAESAQYLKDADTEKLKQTMENIATSARSSLQDVRHVLTAGSGRRAGAARQPRRPHRGGQRERPRGGRRARSAPRSRCRRSWRWSPTACSRRC